ncbi:hypothetical protein ACFYMW_31550 [Streptomyces sp. NPDC006692]|uniref:hypothetical protein n=1 Tax=unclassified Streptomyces TaxID=2593676 RepID=UPI0036C3A068
MRVLALHGLTTTIGGGTSVMTAVMAAAVTSPGRITVIDPTRAAIEAFLARLYEGRGG